MTLSYFGRLYSAYVEAQGGNMYGARLIELPTPRYVVLYNGMQPRPAREVLRLSGAFPGENPSVEVTCEVVNVGSGCNPGVAEASPTLAGYVYLVERVRDYNGVRGMPPARAVDAAIDECVSKGYLASYLERKRSEVRSMFMTEFDEEKQRALDRRDGYEEGVEDAAERLLAAGYDEGAVRIALGLNPEDPLPPKPVRPYGSFMTEFDEEKQRAQDRSDGYRDGFANGIDEGKKQGIEQGIEQGVAQAAERLRAAGYDEEAIRVVLGSRPAE